MKALGWVIVGAVALGAAFIAGRASVRVDDQELRDSLAVWEEHRKQDVADDARDRNALADEHAARVRSEALTAQLIESGARLVAGAAHTMASANERRDSADAILARLRGARTLGDSFAILSASCSERANECALVRKANDSLFKAADTLRAANDTAKLTIASFRRDSTTMANRIKRDSGRIAEADGLVKKLEKNALGCQWPLIGSCPLLLGNFPLGTDAWCEVGIGKPLKPWLIASVTYTPEFCRKKGTP